MAFLYLQFQLNGMEIQEKAPVINTGPQDVANVYDSELYQTWVKEPFLKRNFHFQQYAKHPFLLNRKYYVDKTMASI